MKAGIYQISNSEYHASEGISRSAIMELHKSPLDYYERYLSPDRKKKEPTEAMILGSLVHTLVLEPHNFNEEYFLYEAATGNGSRAINELAKLRNAEKTLIDEKLYAKAELMRDAILNHHKASQLMKGARFEQSIFWKDEESGLMCKARPDIWSEELAVLVDLKTARIASLDSFTYEVKDAGYHIQAAMQIDAVNATSDKKIDSFAFIVAPKELPYKPYIYILGAEIIELGRQEYKEALHVLKLCYETNKWDEDRDEIMEINFSSWQLNKPSRFSKLLEIYK